MVCIVSQTHSPPHVRARVTRTRAHMRGAVVPEKREKHAGTARGRSGGASLNGSSRGVTNTGHWRACPVCLNWCSIFRDTWGQGTAQRHGLASAAVLVPSTRRERCKRPTTTPSFRCPPLARAAALAPRTREIE